MDLVNRKSIRIKKLIMFLSIILSISCIVYAVDNDYDGLDDSKEQYRLTLLFFPYARRFIMPSIINRIKNINETF